MILVIPDVDSSIGMVYCRNRLNDNIEEGHQPPISNNLLAISLPDIMLTPIVNLAKNICYGINGNRVVYYIITLNYKTETTSEHVSISIQDNYSLAYFYFTCITEQKSITLEILEQQFPEVFI